MRNFMNSTSYRILAKFVQKSATHNFSMFSRSTPFIKSRLLCSAILAEKMSKVFSFILAEILSNHFLNESFISVVLCVYIYIFIIL